MSINQDREAYALAAGFALGLINLGRGRWSSGVSNGSIAETLRRLILGGAWGAHHFLTKNIAKQLFVCLSLYIFVAIALL